MSTVTLVTSAYLDYASYLNQGSPPRLTPYVSIGLLSLASVAKEQGWRASVFEINRLLNELAREERLDRKLTRVASVLAADRPQVIGLMTEYYSYHLVLSLAEKIKRIYPDCRIVLGGPQASATAEETLAAFPAPDIVVIGEGETAFGDLLRVLHDGGDLNQVPGIAYRRNGVPIRTRQNRLIDNLDDLPMPAFEDVQLHDGDYATIEVGRGCPFSCAFCSTSMFWRRRYRMKSPARVCAELAELNGRFGIRDVSFIHDCLTADRKKVIELCDAIEAQGLGIRWGCSSRTDTIDQELMERMRRAGCVHLYFGIESGSAETQKAIGKNLDLDEAFAVIRAARANGFEVTTPFMVGFPGERRADLARTFEAIHRAFSEDVYLVQIFVAAPYGDTPLLEAHANEIRYTGHFLDLPMTGDERRRRDDLLRAYPEIFSGHYRFPTDGLERHIAGADQFFPLINEMRYTALSIWKRFDDPLFLYERWLEWLAEHPSRDDRFAATPAYGTFQSFADFLDTLRGGLRESLPYLGDLIDFERTRMDVLAENQFTAVGEARAKAPQTATLSADIRPRVASNAKIKAYAWDVARIIDDINAGKEPGAYPLDGSIALLGRSDRDVRVLKLNAFAGELIEYCRLRMTVDDMVYRVRRRLQQAGATSSETEISMACRKGVSQLAEMGLLRMA
ncbi:MAG: B12-binding domain-containing radical SAM protein [Candidatus Thiodiazotropha sp. (ex Epidulcina cf. delphinae)]|nr:B12-binding domain-containing radical SAM protein [Candidatus Thiodiazotropha sp. (ex Epidulcina cf. delphinae)]